MRYFIIVLLFIATNLVANDFVQLNDQRFNESIKAVANTTEFRVYTYNENRFAVLTNQDSLRFFVLSTDYSRVIGYQGTTTLGIIFNQDMTVERLEIVRSQETAGYIRRLNRMGFPQRFDGFRKGDEVEIITGATMTCEAMIESVNETIEKFGALVEKYLALE
jgi:Na+-translocating ferredoxin:NAD+ oxidoreductase RnfG subunit